jgi:hypothetical protein
MAMLSEATLFGVVGCALTVVGSLLSVVGCLFSIMQIKRLKIE